jgi:hypothetical protein
MGVSVVVAQHALHPTQYVDDGVPVIPRVLEHVGVVNLVIYPVRVLDEVIDVAGNVPG